MNVHTIAMPRFEAAEKAEAYREAFNKKGDPTDRTLARLYRQLARGIVLLNLIDVNEARWRRRAASALARHRAR